MDIEKIFNVDEVPDNLFDSVSSTVSELRALQRKKAAENAQAVIQALQKMKGDLEGKYDSVYSMLESRIASIQDGNDGADGRNGRDGKDGQDGAQGRDGRDGMDGINGLDGADGVSIADIRLDFDNSLIITLTNGREINAGEILPPDITDRLKIIINSGANGGSGGSGTPAGANTQIQYNDNGSFGASAALTFDGTNLVTTGNSTARAFIPSNSTVPTNGLFLPAANTIGFSTNTAERMRIDSTGQVGIGATPSAGRNLTLSKTLTGSVGSYAQLNAGAVQSDVTTAAYYFSSFASTASANFALSQLSHYATGGPSTFANVTAGGSVGSQYGFAAESNLIGATNNFGFYGNIASGTGRYNFYAQGTAPNYMAGSLGIGSISTTQYALRISKNITGNAISYGTYIDSNIQSDVTSVAYGHFTALGTAASAFTLNELNHFTASQATFGAGSTVTTQYGFQAASNLTGATNNFGFYGNIASGTGRYNFYAQGTAQNLFSGDVLVFGAGSLGYTTGSGGAVTQGTSRTTGVTLNKTNGAITLFSAAGSITATTFTVTNSTVAATDVVHVSQKSGTNLYIAMVTATAAGSFNITFYTTGGVATDAPVFNFAVIKAVAA